MHTIIVVGGGLALLLACLLLGHAFGGGMPGVVTGAKLFIPLWLVLAAVNMWIGVSQAGYSVAEELRAHKIRVSVVCPGSVHTEFSPHPGKDPERMLQPDDVAHAVQMLVTQAPQSFASEVVLRPTLKP